MSNTPAHSTIVRGAFEIMMRNIAGGRPARVLTYDAVKQRAEIQPLVYELNPVTGVRERPPAITDVPVLMLGTARDRTTMEIRAGDTVWVCSASVSLDTYLISGGEVDPGDDRRYAHSDAVCFPAMFDFGHVPGDASTDGMVIHSGKLRLGGPDASDPVVRKSDLDAVVSSIKSDLASLKTHFHPASSGTTSASAQLTGINTVTTPACSPVVTSK